VEEECIQCASFIKKGTAATAMLALITMVISFMTMLPSFTFPFVYTHQAHLQGKKTIKWRKEEEKDKGKMDKGEGHGKCSIHL